MAARERLVELVRNAGRHFAHRREAGDAVHALQRLVSFTFGAPLIGDVLARQHDARGHVVGVA
jgi:hypothetical protein